MYRKAGGSITSQRFEGTLMITRALGDMALKSKTKVQYSMIISYVKGLISEPYVTHVYLTPSDNYLVLGSDGLWDYLKYEVKLQE